MSYDHRSYERNLSNCVEKPEKVRTSRGFESAVQCKLWNISYITSQAKILLVHFGRFLLLWAHYRGAVMAQWWEHTPPANVTRFRFPDPACGLSFVGSLLCTERFSPGTPVSPLIKNQHLTWFVLIVNFSLQCSQLVLLRLERLDTQIKFLYFCLVFSVNALSRNFTEMGEVIFTYQFIAVARQKWNDDCRLKWKLKASKILQNCFTLCNLVYYGILVVKIVFYFSFVSKFQSAFLLLTYLCFTYSTFVFVFSSVKSRVWFQQKMLSCHPLTSTNGWNHSDWSNAYQRDRLLPDSFYIAPTTIPITLTCFHPF